MTLTPRTVGGYVAGLSLTGLAVLLLGFGTLHLLVAVPQAVLPVVGGLVTLGAGLVTLPAVRRSVRRRTGHDLTPATVRRTVLGALLATTVLALLYVGISLS